MKKKIITVLILIIVVGPLGALSRNPVVKGRVLNETGECASFATVILTGTDESQAAGVVTDQDGAYTFDAPEGEYTLTISYLGYLTYSVPIKLDKDITNCDVTLIPADTRIDAVEVTARHITREADRFVVNVSNNPAAIGRNAMEMLAISPSVWATDEDIKINGRSGVRVMIDERMLNLSPEDVITYLKGINAEDIQKIEVIPVAGADFDADSRGGIIKITLKKQRHDGIEGAVSFWSSATSGIWSTEPYLMLNYKKNKVSLYTNFYYSHGEDYHSGTEGTIYHDGSFSQQGRMRVDNVTDYGNGKLGVVYDVNDRNSIGAEYFMAGWHQDVDTKGESTAESAGMITENRNRYGTDARYTHISAAVNYILKLDTLGSNFKLIADFTNRNPRNNNTYGNSAVYYPVSSPDDILRADSVYRDRRRSEFRIWSAGASLEKIFSPSSVLRTGVKFIYNTTDNSTVYHYRPGAVGEWTAASGYNIVSDYTEKISAIYAVYSGRIKNISYQLGLRGEYTYAVPRVKEGLSTGGRNKQDYFSLFPDLNVSIPLNEKQSNSLIFTYGRKISRPGFWELTPSVLQLSEYTTVIGNPDLEPTFNHDFGLTAVFGYKYTVSAGAQLVKDGINQLVFPDEDNKGHNIYQHRNIPDAWNYYLVANIPVNPVKWWTINANLTGMYMRQRVFPDDPVTDSWFGSFYVNNIFSLPKGFVFEADFHGYSDVIFGNVKQLASANFDLGVKKKFFHDRLTVSATLKNVLNGYNFRTQRIKVNGEEYKSYNNLRYNWSQRMMKFSVRYTFKAGKSFNVKNVERSGDEGRL